MSNYLELAQLSDGSIVLRRSDDHENPIVRIEFSSESKEFLQGQELSVAKEMIRAGGLVNFCSKLIESKERDSPSCIIGNISSSPSEEIF